jgi:hypothetical protein
LSLEPQDRGLTLGVSTDQVWPPTASKVQGERERGRDGKGGRERKREPSLKKIVFLILSVALQLYRGMTRVDQKYYMSCLTLRTGSAGSC